MPTPSKIKFFYDPRGQVIRTNCELARDGATIEKEEYYPFGETSFASYGEKRYKYCGKERDTESGLCYYGARYYNSWTCRFFGVDPLKDKYHYYTPYQYAGNKPVNFIDLDGKEEASNGNTNSDTNGQNNGTSTKVSTNKGEKIIHQKLKNNISWLAIMAVASKVKEQQEFDKELENQNKFDVYYFPVTNKIKLPGEGIETYNVSSNIQSFGFPEAHDRLASTKLVRNLEELEMLKKNDPYYSQVDPKDLQRSFNQGKEVILIGYSEGLLNPINGSNLTLFMFKNFRISGIEAIIHEEISHALTIILGHDLDMKIEHQKYHGDYSYYSPHTESYLFDSKYRKSIGGNITRQIKGILDKIYK